MNFIQYPLSRLVIQINIGIIRHGGSIGSLATLYCKPRQDRKVATVVDTVCAEDVLVESLFFV